MKDNIMKLLEIASEDRDFSEKLKKASTTEEIKALADEKGLTLSDEDLDRNTAVSELSDDEVEAVSGGGSCVCVVGGGGTEDGGGKTCACVIGGIGDYKDPYLGMNARCSCFYFGTGDGND